VDDSVQTLHRSKYPPRPFGERVGVRGLS
jgi:hypothetical protein